MNGVHDRNTATDGAPGPPVTTTGGGIRFAVLGEIAVLDGDGNPVRVPELKVRALLASLLAAHLVDAGRPVAAHRLIDDLWGEEQPGNPLRALQAKVSQLRRVFDEVRPGGRAHLASRAPGYQLLVPQGALDADRFRELAERARQVPDADARAALLAGALDLWRGPAFADFAEETFARTAVERLEEERLTLVEERSAARLDAGDHLALATELAPLVAEHPLRERLTAVHVRALYRAGRQGDALTAYERLRHRLADDLGVDPSPELAALHGAVLRQDPELSAPPAPARAVVAPRTNLFVPPGELVGRDGAVAEVAQLLTGRRLVTLTGPGGVGKTRLALAVADRARNDFPDGTWLVELARDGEPVEAVAAALGLRDDGVWGVQEPSSPAEKLAAALRGTRTLLVLDNCEHVVDEVAGLVETLLRRAPEVVVLTTSRESLALAPETLWQVPPLDPAGGVQLFAERAASAAPGFVLDDSNRDAALAVVRRLDGIPLALELAATRVRALGVERLLTRLDDRFRLLDGGQRGAPARQRTLRAVIDWSWEPLAEDERAVLRRLAPHPDGYALEGAEAVCAGDGVEAADVFGLLARLVDRSLVQVSADGSRYRLLESVAAYGNERLVEACELDAVHERHLARDTALAEAAVPGLRDGRQAGVLELLDTERANLRWALDTALARGDASHALRLCDALAWYWVLRGRLGEARRALTAARDLPGGDPAARARAAVWLTGVRIMSGDGADRAVRIAAALAETDALDGGATGSGAVRARWFLGHSLAGTGDLTAAEALTGPALEGFRALGDRWGEAAALSDRSAQRLLRGDLTGAADDAVRGAGLFAELGDACGQVWSVYARASVAEIHGDYEAARAVQEDALETARRFGLSTLAADLLAGLGRIALLQRDFDTARARHGQALREAAALDFRAGEINARLGLGLGARREGGLDEAEWQLRQVLDWHREVGLEGANALVLAELGFVAELRGDVPAALRLHCEGYRVALTTGDPRAVALALEGLAGAVAPGNPAGAALLLGCAAATRESTGAPLSRAEHGDVDRASALARDALGEAGFTEVFGGGGRLTPEDAVRAAGAG
ncbi:ATP-binding protein [Streptomyces sp. NPDC059816]|uniref:ATP-binding protein n=1 Tax=Streptomyces sp. NPDC059816 TaxID=3346960 RepID=UPI0036567FBC